MAIRKHQWPIKQNPDFFHKLHSESFTTDSLWHRDPHSIKDHQCLQACLQLDEPLKNHLMP
jgi:hypothetical protein